MEKKQYDTIDEAKRKRLAQQKRHVVGFVDPQGVVRQIVCRPSDSDDANGLMRGSVPAELIQGQVMLTVYGRQAGWKSLEEMCIADSVPERYAEWLRVVRARLDGAPVHVPNLAAIYPPSLLELRKNVKTRSASSVYVAGQGYVDVQGLSPEAKQARIAGMGTALGLELAKPGDQAAEAGGGI